MESQKAAMATDQADRRDGISRSGSHVGREGVDRDMVGFPPGSLVAGDARSLRTFPIELVTDQFKVVIHREIT
jgi:hypothetical protein